MPAKISKPLRNTLAALGFDDARREVGSPSEIGNRLSKFLVIKFTNGILMDDPRVHQVLSLIERSQSPANTNCVEEVEDGDKGTHQTRILADVPLARVASIALLDGVCHISEAEKGDLEEKLRTVGQDLARLKMLTPVRDAAEREAVRTRLQLE